MDTETLKTAQKFMGETVQKRPANFGITTSEFAAKQNLTKAAAARLLARAFEIGVLDRAIYNSPRGGNLYVYFKPRKKSK